MRSQFKDELGGELGRELRNELGGDLGKELGRAHATETLPCAWGAISRICFCSAVSVEVSAAARNELTPAAAVGKGVWADRSGDKTNAAAQAHATHNGKDLFMTIEG